VLSIKDFYDYCGREGIEIVRQRFLVGKRWVSSAIWKGAANLLAGIGMFVITRRGAACTHREKV
jgi:hypothetical protein